MAFRKPYQAPSSLRNAGRKTPDQTATPPGELASATHSTAQYGSSGHGATTPPRRPAPAVNNNNTLLKRQPINNTLEKQTQPVKDTNSSTPLPVKHSKTSSMNDTSTAKSNGLLASPPSPSTSRERSNSAEKGHRKNSKSLLGNLGNSISNLFQSTMPSSALSAELNSTFPSKSRRNTASSKDPEMEEEKLVPPSAHDTDAHGVEDMDSDDDSDGEAAIAAIASHLRHKSSLEHLKKSSQEHVHTVSKADKNNPTASESKIKSISDAKDLASTTVGSKRQADHERTPLAHSDDDDDDDVPPPPPPPTEDSDKNSTKSAKTAKVTTDVDSTEAKLLPLDDISRGQKIAFLMSMEKNHPLPGPKARQPMLLMDPSAFPKAAPHLIDRASAPVDFATGLSERAQRLSHAFGSSTTDDIDEFSIPTPPEEDPETEGVVSTKERSSKAEAAFAELIATEKSYIEGLNNLHRHFILGLRAHVELKSETPILTEDEIRKCFMNVSEISVLSTRLLSELKQLRRDKADLGEVGKLFLKVTPFFKIYSNYTESFDSSTSLLKHLKKTIPRLTSFIRIQEFCVGSKLDQLRSLPIQRIPRYLLLLKEMAKNFPEDTETFKQLDTAWNEVYRVAEQVDESIDMASAKKEVFFLQEVVFKNKVNLVTSSRYCVRYSYLTKVFHSKKRKEFSKSKEYVFFLFDDCLCYASVSQNFKTAHMKHVLPLVDMLIEDLVDSAELQNCFLIKSSYKSIIVSATTADLKESWMSDLISHSQILTSNYATLQKTPPKGEELERQILGSASGKGKQVSNLANASLDRTTTAEKLAKLENLSREPVVLLSAKQRDRLRQVAEKLSDENKKDVAIWIHDL